eukprot:s2665_g3.t1
MVKSPTLYGLGLLEVLWSAWVRLPRMGVQCRSTAMLVRSSWDRCFGNWSVSACVEWTEWIGRNRDREDVVLLQKDVKNVFNELLPVQFIQDARQFVPASAGFVEWYYGANSHLIYRGRLESSSRG